MARRPRLTPLLAAAALAVCGTVVTEVSSGAGVASASPGYPAPSATSPAITCPNTHGADEAFQWSGSGGWCVGTATLPDGTVLHNTYIPLDCPVGDFTVLDVSDFSSSTLRAVGPGGDIAFTWQDAGRMCTEYISRLPDSPPPPSGPDGPRTAAPHPTGAPHPTHAQSLTTAKARTVVYGSRLSLSTRLSSDAARSNVAVTLQRKSGTSWVTAASARTTSSGATSVSIAPKANATYRWSTPALAATTSHDGYSSAVSSPFAVAVQVKHGTVKVAGTARAKHRLTAKVSGWAPSGLTYHYQWYVGSKKVSAATHRTAVVKKSWRGKTVSVRVTGAKPGLVSAVRAATTGHPVAAA